MVQIRLMALAGSSHWPWLPVAPHFLPPQNFSFQPNFGINTFIPEFVVDFSRGKLQNIPQYLTTRSGTHRTIHNAMTPLLCTFLYLSKTSEFVTAAWSRLSASIVCCAVCCVMRMRVSCAENHKLNIAQQNEKLLFTCQLQSTGWLHTRICQIFFVCLAWFALHEFTALLDVCSRFPVGTLSKQEKQQTGWFRSIFPPILTWRKFFFGRFMCVRLTCCLVAVCVRRVCIEMCCDAWTRI